MCCTGYWQASNEAQDNSIGDSTAQHAEETEHTHPSQLLGEEVDEVVMELDLEKPITDMADCMLSSFSCRTREDRAERGK